jgi:hypothetical protein
MRSRRVPRIVLNKPNLRSLNALRSRRESESTNVGLLSSNRINQCSSPGGPSRVLDLQQVSIGVCAIDVHGAADARTAVCSIAAVAITRSSSVDEAGKDCVDYRCRARVFAGLEARVAHVVLADEIELLGEVVSGGVGSTWHEYREGNVLQTG